MMSRAVRRMIEDEKRAEIKCEMCGIRSPMPYHGLCSICWASTELRQR